MARRKKVEEKNYDELIIISERKIEDLTAELKDEKANLKKLKKDKTIYDEMMEKQKKEEELRAVTELIMSSGKTLDEIKELLKINTEEVNTETD